MKQLSVILSLLLSACQSDVYRVHVQAISAASRGNEACYAISEPHEIRGEFCLRYEGNKK